MEETRALSARMASTLAKGQERTRDVYWGRMTWTLWAKEFMRKRLIIVKVGFSTRNRVNREA